MWISKSEYNHLQEVIQNQSKSIDEYSKINFEQRKQFDDRQVPFSTYYAERLEWWKKQFDKKPEKHKVRILVTQTEWYDKSFETIQDCENYCIFLKNEIRLFNDPLQGDKVAETDEHIVPINKIRSFFIIKLHPEPYTDSEIESWAKEQLEKEMQSWKVVKEENKDWTINDVIKTIEHLNSLPKTAREVTALKNAAGFWKFGNMV